MIAVRWATREEPSGQSQHAGGWRLRRATGRALLTAALTERGAPAATVTRELGTKPRLDIDGLHFSTSHSGNVSVCAVADAPIGIDLELRGAPRELRLARGLPLGFFTADERQEIAETPTRMLEIFVLKEAWSKRDGHGIGIGFGGFDERTLLGAGDDLEFTRLEIPAAVCILAHSPSAVVSLRRDCPTAAELAAGMAADQKERAA